MKINQLLSWAFKNPIFLNSSESLEAKKFMNVEDHNFIFHFISASLNKLYPSLIAGKFIDIATIFADVSK